jgi:hypothetical protein
VELPRPRRIGTTLPVRLRDAVPLELAAHDRGRRAAHPPRDLLDGQPLADAVEQPPLIERTADTAEWPGFDDPRRRERAAHARLLACLASWRCTSNGFGNAIGRPARIASSAIVRGLTSGSGGTPGTRGRR